MANGKVEKVASAVATNDFFKSNGLDRSAHEVHPGGPSMTRQEFAAECDINSIMKTYDGFLADPAKSIREPQYVNFADMPQDLMGFMGVMKEGEAAFMRLPAAVRKEFDNDAVQFVEYAMNPENVKQMREWGLAEPDKAAKPPADIDGKGAMGQPAPAGGVAPGAQAPGAGAAPAGASAPAGAGSTHGST